MAEMESVASEHLAGTKGCRLSVLEGRGKAFIGEDVAGEPEN